MSSESIEDNNDFRIPNYCKGKNKKASKDSIQICGQQVTILSCQNITIMSRLNSCSWDMPEPLGVLDYK